MKMPTAVARHKVPWKPGDPVSFPLGEESLSPEEPPFSPTYGHSRVPPASRDEGRMSSSVAGGGGGGGGSGGAAVSSSLLFPPPSSGSSESTMKRFPILGPTRQDTELYFRRRRPPRNRIRTAGRPLVTRSADRVVPADYSPATLTYSTSLTPTPARPHTTANHPHHPEDFRYVEINTNGHNIVTEASLDYGRDSQTHLKPATAFPRSGSSPAGTRTALPSFERSASFHGGSGLVRRGVGRKYEIPIKFLSETGQVRVSQHTHRVNKTSSHGSKQNQKTLQPSKYGYHARSKSPTFKTLVEAAEKLQNVSTQDPNSDEHESETCHMCMKSQFGARFPAVVRVDDAEGSSIDEHVTYLQPHEIISTVTFSLQTTNDSAKCNKFRHLTSQSAKTPSSRKSILSKSANTYGNVDARPQTNGGIDRGSGTPVESVDPLWLNMPLGSPTDIPTELHLFLPRLADNNSEEGGSGAASKNSSDRFRSRLPNNVRASTHMQRSKTAVHPHTSLRPPQYPNLQGAPSMERPSRPQSRRYSSPVRAQRRDRTPKRRMNGASGTGEVCEMYEPFIKGEHLKEKLEDFPTLISLDQD